MLVAQVKKSADRLLLEVIAIVLGRCYVRSYGILSLFKHNNKISLSLNAFNFQEFFKNTNRFALSSTVCLVYRSKY